MAHGLKDEFYDEMFKELDDKDVYGIFPMMLRPRSRKYIEHIEKHLIIELMN